VNTFTQFEKMLQEEAERVADLCLESGRGSRKIDTRPLWPFLKLTHLMFTRTFRNEF